MVQRSIQQTRLAPNLCFEPCAIHANFKWRSSELTCRDATCSLCGKATSYEEKEIGFQDETLLRTWHTRSSNN
jgi:hypothetical protein